MTETLTDKERERREKKNAYRRTEEYKAKRRATRDLSKDRERWKKYYAVNKEYLLQRAKEYREQPEVKERYKELKHQEYLRKGKQRGLDAIKNLSDRYLKSVLIRGTKLTYKNIPEEFVEVKRLEILIKREHLKNTTKEERRKASNEKYATKKRIQSMQYYYANKEKALAAAKKWREKNKESVNAKRRNMTPEQRERRNALARARYNPEKQKEKDKVYREANKDKIKAYRLKRYAENKEEIKAKRRNRTPEERAHINALARAAVKRRKLLTKENQNENRN